MRAIQRAARAAGLVLAALALAGCLDLGRMVLEYEVEEGLKGRLTVTVYGVRSTSSKPERREREYRDFVQKEYLQEGLELARKFGLLGAKVVLSNTTDEGTDAVLTGRFETLVTALGPLTQEGGFRIERTGRRLAVALRRGQGVEKRIALALRYAGRILSHNAHKFDPKAHRMEWDFEKLDAEGLRFTLEVP